MCTSLNVFNYVAKLQNVLSRYLRWSGRKMFVDIQMVLSFQDLKNEVLQGGGGSYPLETYNCPFTTHHLGKRIFKRPQHYLPKIATDS